MIRTTTLLVSVLISPSIVATPQEDTIHIYVYGRMIEKLEKSEKKALEKQLKEKRSQQEKVTKKLQKQLEKEHGKNVENWPADSRTEYEESLRADLLATLEYHKVTVKPKETLDSAKDIGKSIEKVIESKNKTGVLLSSHEENAKLVVEVLTRRKKSGFPAYWQFVYLKVTPTGWEMPVELAETAFKRKEEAGQLGVGLLSPMGVGRTVKTLRPYGDEGPYWIIEVGLQGKSWGELGYFAAEVLTDLVDPDVSETDGSP